MAAFARSFASYNLGPVAHGFENYALGVSLVVGGGFVYEAGLAVYGVAISHPATTAAIVYATAITNGAMSPKEQEWLQEIVEEFKFEQEWWMHHW